MLLDDITFLKDQLRQKDKVIDSLINQLSKQNYLFQKGNTDNQLETNLESIKSKEESVKSKETEKIIITVNNNKTTKRKTMEKRKVKKTQKQASVTKKAVKKIFHMKLNLLITSPKKK